MTPFRMARSVLILPIFCAIVMLAGTRGGAAKSVSSKDFYGRVIQVDTGDRLDVRHHGEIYHLRLYDIRCPGGHDGERAKALARDMALMRGVRVHIIGRDAKGLTLADVRFVDGRRISTELVRAGVATLDTHSLRSEFIETVASASAKPPLSITP